MTPRWSNRDPGVKLVVKFLYCLTFTCLLGCGIMHLPSIMTVWQIWTLEPWFVPHMVVPDWMKKKKEIDLRSYCMQTRSVFGVYDRYYRFERFLISTGEGIKHCLHCYSSVSLSPGFHSMKRLKVSPTSLDGILVNNFRVTRSIWSSFSNS